MKGTHGLQQRALALFTAGIALSTPMSWLLQDWYDGKLQGFDLVFKCSFGITHLLCGITLIIWSIIIHDKIDKKESL